MLRQTLLIHISTQVYHSQVVREQHNGYKKSLSEPALKAIRSKNSSILHCACARPTAGDFPETL